MSNTKIDRQVIIAWNSDSALIQEIESTFNSDIILKKEITLTPAQRAEKINKVYHPIHVPHNSARCNYVEPLTLFVVQMEPKYKYYLRTEGYLLCNTTILEFKIKNRKKFHFELFHCSDSVEEAKKALIVFGLEQFIPKCHIVNVDSINHITHIADGSIEISNLKNSVSIQHLIGYSIEYLNKKYNLLTVEEDIHVVKTKSFEYFDSLENFNQEHPMCCVEAYKHSDQFYVVTDGKHRSALLYFRGDRHIFINESLPPCTTDHLLSSIRSAKDNSHLENLNKIIYSLHNQNIRFVVIRGYKTMPKTADTDLDIVIHPEDYSKFLSLMEQHMKEGTALFNVEKSYKHNPTAWYRAYRTTGVYNEFLTNKGYQLDTYNNAFFFGTQENAVALSKNFLDYLFVNRKKYYQLYIPNELSEMILLFCRTHIDLGGKWKVKHQERFHEAKLFANISKEQFNNALKIALDPSYLHLLIYVDSLFA